MASGLNRSQAVTGSRNRHQLDGGGSGDAMAEHEE